MRKLIVLATLSSLAAGAAFAKPIKDNQSPALKQCIQTCKSEKGATAHEGCLIQCVNEDAARQKQKSSPPAK